jgi:hypothetical protein
MLEDSGILAFGDVLGARIDCGDVLDIKGVHRARPQRGGTRMKDAFER